ncbi:MAG: discoidin domain-containing protein [Bacillota bacterium]
MKTIDYTALNSVNQIELGVNAQRVHLTFKDLKAIPYADGYVAEISDITLYTLSYYPQDQWAFYAQDSYDEVDDLWETEAYPVSIPAYPTDTARIEYVYINGKEATSSQWDSRTFSNGTESATFIYEPYISGGPKVRVFLRNAYSYYYSFIITGVSYEPYYSAIGIYPVGSSYSGSYAASNINDGRSDTRWISAGKDVQTEQESLNITFALSQKVNSLYIDPVFTGLNLTVKSGQTVLATFKDLKEGTYTFPTVTTNNLTLTFTNLQPGGFYKQNDTKYFAGVNEISFQYNTLLPSGPDGYYLYSAPLASNSSPRDVILKSDAYLPSLTSISYDIGKIDASGNFVKTASLTPGVKYTLPALSNPVLRAKMAPANGLSPELLGWELATPGQLYTLTINNTVSTTPPQITILGPAAGETVSGMASVSVLVNSTRPVRQVEMYVDNEWVSTAYNPPYTFALDTTGYNNGGHEIMVKVLDADSLYTSTRRSLVYNYAGDTFLSDALIDQNKTTASYDLSSGKVYATTTGPDLSVSASATSTQGPSYTKVVPVNAFASSSHTNYSVTGPGSYSVHLNGYDLYSLVSFSRNGYDIPVQFFHDYDSSYGIGGANTIPTGITYTANILQGQSATMDTSEMPYFLSVNDSYNNLSGRDATYITLTPTQGLYDVYVDYQYTSAYVNADVPAHATVNNARDNNYSTAWKSKGTGSAGAIDWLTIDLGSVYSDLKRYGFTTMSIGTTVTKIEVSIDNSTWTLVGTPNAAVGAGSSYTYYDTQRRQGRYVRFTFSNTGYIYGAYMVWIAEAYAYREFPTYEAIKAIDNNSSTYWRTPYLDYQSSGEKLTIDLGSVQKVNSVKLTPLYISQRVAVELSSDGVNFTRVAESTANQIDFNETTARYVRLNFTQMAYMGSYQKWYYDYYWGWYYYWVPQYAAGFYEVEVKDKPTYYSKPLTTSGKAITKIRLNTQQSTPAGTSIAYSISVDDGANWNLITPGVDTGLAKATKSLLLRAVFSGASATAVPEIQEWSITALEQTDVFINVDNSAAVRPPSTLTARGIAGGGADLAWIPSPTPGATYKIYRGTTSGFVLDAATLVASAVTTSSWHDSSTGSFYYRVTASKPTGQESKPTNEAFAEAGYSNEQNERLGLEDYWPYSAHDLADGTAYVNTSNGNMAFEATDLVLPGQNTVITFRRTYNSMNKENFGLGYGWDFNHNIRLYFQANGDIKLKDGDGTYHTFTYNAVTQKYTRPPGVFISLVKNADGTYLVTYNDQTKFRFRTDGLLSSIDDRYSKSNITYEYILINGQNRLTKILDPVRRQTTLTWATVQTNNGPMDVIYRVAQSLVPTGPNAGTQSVDRNIYFTYDAEGNLAGAANAEGSQYLYFYDTAHNMVKTMDPLGRQTQVTYDNYGKITDIDYLMEASKTEGAHFYYSTPETVIYGKDGSNWLPGYVINSHNNNGTLRERVLPGDGTTKATAKFEYDSDYNVTKVTDPKGNITQYQYENGNLKKAIDAAGNETLFSYNGQNDLTLTTYPGGKGTTVNDYVYNPSIGGLVLNKTTTTFNNDLLPVTYNYSYYDNGQLLWKLDGTGSTYYEYYPEAGYLQNTYRADGDIVQSSITNYEYDAFGNLTRFTDPNGRITLQTYDKLGRLQKKTYPDNSYEAYTYDSAGNLISSRDRNGNIASYKYDARNRVTEEKIPGRGTVTYQYDAFGNLLVKNDNGQINRYEYDINNQLAAEISENVQDHDPITNTTRQVSLKTEFKYDLSGNPQSKTLSGSVNGTTVESYSVQFQYNNRDLLEKAQDDSGYYLTYTYDVLGNKASSIERGNAQRTTKYEYDILGRLRKVTEPSADGVIAGGVTSYEYDGNGNRVKVTDAKGNLTTSSFNHLNLPVSKSQSVTSSVGLQGYTASDRSIYDKVGNRLSYTDPNGKQIQYEYDINDRLVKVTYPSGEMVKYTYDLVGNRLTMTDFRGTTYYTYDEAYRLLTENAPDGQTVSYQYDNLGRRSAMTLLNRTAGEISNITYKYDASNRLVEVSGAQGVTKYRYDARDLPIAIKYPNGDIVTLLYDQVGNLKKIEAKNSAGAQIVSYQYEYDLYNNRNRVVVSGTEKPGATNYVFDNLNRLKQVSYPWSQTAWYTYDLLGNRLTESFNNGSSNTYFYNSISQLERVQSNNGEKIDYRYDKNGNQVAVITQSGETQYIYDLENRLKEIVFPNNDHVWYNYDGDGRRVYQKDGINETYYGYDGSGPIVHYDGSGAVLASYLRGMGGMLVGTTQKGGTYYYHLDGLGSIVAMTDGTGAKTAIYDYDAFGNQVSQKPNIYNPYGFTSGLYDQNPGLYFFSSRYYNPKVGRFITQDSYSGSLTEPWTQHLYTYVGNNPVNYVDPTGHVVQLLAIYAGAVASSPDTMLDMQMLAYDLAEGNYLEAALDIVGMAIPGVSSQVVKGGVKAGVKVAKKFADLAGTVIKNENGSFKIINENVNAARKIEFVSKHKLNLVIAEHGEDLRTALKRPVNYYSNTDNFLQDLTDLTANKSKFLQDYRGELQYFTNFKAGNKRFQLIENLGEEAVTILYKPAKKRR